MLTDVVCRTPSHRRSLIKVAASSNASGYPVSPLLNAHHHQQVRLYRFGMWASCLDHEFHNDLRRHHRMLKHKHMEALNRKLLWEQYPFSEDSKTAIKRMFLRYWAPARGGCGSRYVDQDELLSRQKHTQRGSNTTDACADKSSTPGPWQKYHFWKSQMEDAVNNHRTKQAPAWKNQANSKFSSSSGMQASAEAKSHKDEHRSEVSSEEDYFIDPITNRKVAKSHRPPKDGVESPASTFKTYRAQFQTFTPPNAEQKPSPIHSNGPPPPEELKEYRKTNVDDWPSYRNQKKDQNVTPRQPQQPSAQSEEYALNHLPPDEPADQYDDLHKYQQYHYDESCEQVQEPVKKYDDLDQYKMDMHYEADDTTLKETKDTGDLHKYKPYMYNANEVEENGSNRYDDLDQYKPYEYQENVKPEDSSPKYDDLDKYQYHQQDESRSFNDPAPEYEDLDKYDSTKFDDFLAQEQPFEQYGDLEKYKKFRHQDIDSKAALERDIVAESLKEFEAKQQTSDLSEKSRDSIEDRLQKVDLHSGRYNSDSIPPLSSSRKTDNPSSNNREPREHLEQAMSSHNKASATADREASSAVRMSRRRTKSEKNETDQREMTGNYIRDFPEEFSGSWTSKPRDSSLERRVTSESKRHHELEARIQAAEKHYSDTLADSVNRSKPETALDRQRNKSRLETALDRQQTKAAINSSSGHSAAKPEPDPYSKEPQGLETSYAEESEMNQTLPTFMKMYGGEPGRTDPASVSAKKNTSKVVFSSPEPSYHRDPEVDGFPPSSSFQSTTESKTDRKPDPTVYKILAYDPIMQNINIAETTSIVPDQASPSTPAEVLLRLSNPTKFFPHFAPLQAEGFEILSGAGDVLVFRQVRPGKAPNQKATTVNPIDMMGKPTPLPNAASFASPTGFVNYDIPPVEEPQSPPFRSNIDVRREEPVFSGPKSSTSEGTPKQKKRSRLGKRILLGGVWVAGISYALGVVSEYFMTGGVDGQGPGGL
ncbi:hypothetical protein F4779DRAFT_260936 [Xylariaceae sp. FL0662B]|nr:hypothetical protein F4779DRAFT_260936 [Xylariaceae sp. FL0662B]